MPLLLLFLLVSFILTTASGTYLDLTLLKLGSLDLRLQIGLPKWRIQEVLTSAERAKAPPALEVR